MNNYVGFRCCSVQLMRSLEKVVHPNVVHFSVVDATTNAGVTTLCYAITLLLENTTSDCQLLQCHAVSHSTSYH